MGDGMKWLQTKRDAWATRALDALWAGQEPRLSWWFGPKALAAALEHNANLRSRCDVLAVLELELSGTTPQLSAADADLLGLEATDNGPSYTSFETRLHTYLAGVDTEDPVKTQALAISGGLAVAIVLALLLWMPGYEPLDDGFQARGAGPAPAHQLEVSALCIGESQGNPVVRLGAEQGRLSCQLSESFQVTVADPGASGPYVAAFVLANDGIDGLRAIPHVPTPTRPQAFRMKPHAGAQPVGRPHRLSVNHPVGEGWFVVVSSSTPIDFSKLEAIMAKGQDNVSPGATQREVREMLFDQSEQAMGLDQIEDVVVMPFNVEGAQ